MKRKILQDILRNSNTTIRENKVSRHKKKSRLKTIGSELEDNIKEEIEEEFIKISEEIEEPDPVVIGITGTVGKTTFAYILNEYFKKIGKRTILVSSASVDDPVTDITKDYAVQHTIENKKEALNYINDALDYKAEIVIIEVPDESIWGFRKENQVEDIPFDIKVLTEFWGNWREPDVEEEDYFNSKSRFFTEDNCKYFFQTNCEKLQKFVEKINSVPVYYGSKYNKNSLKVGDIQSVCTDFVPGITQSFFGINCNNVDYKFYTSLMFNHSLLNLCGIIAVIDYLNLMNKEVFYDLVKNITVPGRAQKILANNRTIIITLTFLNEISFLQELLDNRYQSLIEEHFNNTGKLIDTKINKIKVLEGISGYDTKKWTLSNRDNSIFNTKYLESNKKLRTLIPSCVDTVYLTCKNPGEVKEEDLIALAPELFDRPVITVPNRRKAIKKIIEDSEENDVLIISGRGNFKEYLTQKGYDFFTDEEVVKEVITELKW